MKLSFTVAAVIVIASAAILFNIRLDLTSDRRFTLSTPTKKILSGLKNDIYIQVYLDGEIPIPLKRLKRSATELLEEFRIASGRKVEFEFINPSEGKNEEQRNAMYESLMKKGLTPVNIQATGEEGGSSQKIIFPGMIVNYNGTEVPVNFLKNDPTIPYEQNILHSTEGLEYELIQTIATLSSDTVYKVAFLEGQGEYPEIETADLTLNLAKFFTIDRGSIGGKPGSLDNYSAVIIAGPQNEFSEEDKFVIDQYIMNGGKVLWLIDEVYVNSDSLTLGQTAALYRPLNVEDQLFRYGVRINPTIVKDLDCQEIRLKVVGSGGRQQFVPSYWVYYPLLSPSKMHPVTKNINKVRGEFVNYIDTVGLDPSIHKNILLSTSAYSRTVNPPFMIELREAEKLPDEKEYSKSNLPVAVLLEGKFPSAYRNRMISSIVNGYSGPVKYESASTKMIVVADANIIRNEVRHSATEEMPLPLGQDIYTGMMYGNRDFLLNSLNYLVDDKGLLNLRSREIKIRLLNAARVRNEKLKWQLINVAIPVFLVIVAGLIHAFLRKRKFSMTR
jgi:gliding-associated putative ABC transporter substrate-binding component GldG